MSDFSTPTTSGTEDAQFLAPETHQRAGGEAVQCQEEAANEYRGMSATYSPEDNKLRLYALHRLDAELYQRVKNHGFTWAPKQGCFVAGMWTPEREDLLLKLCGELGDEDKSLVERAQERAERFEGYEGKRRGEAGAARATVDGIAQHIPFGQPILVGHHSERRARKDAERIENGMRKAVQLWDTADYWRERAAGALLHARYKERPDVRARRIKKIEADQRKQQRYLDDARLEFKLWSKESLTLEQARAIAERVRLTVVRGEGDDLTTRWTAYDVLRPDEERYSRCPSWTVEQVQEAAKRAYPRTIARCERWIAHYTNRLMYERAMLNEQGGTAADRTGPEVGGGAKCWASPSGGWSYIRKVNKVSITVEDNWGNGGGNFTRTIPFDKLSQLMTLAQVQAAREDGTLKEAADKTGFYILRSREKHDAEEAAAGAPAPLAKTEGEGVSGEDPAAFAALKEQLRLGVKVVIAPQLFETSNEVAAQAVDQVVDLLQPGAKLLEPSAGTGQLLRALPGVSPFPGNRQTLLDVTAVELNADLAGALKSSGLATRVCSSDFLECTVEDLGGPFAVILMNPPFADGADIKHILHAVPMLAPGGRLVAICAQGPRQQRVLGTLVEARGGTWEPLPEDAFKHAGTGVRTALITIPA